MKELLIATKNPGKSTEIAAWLQGVGIYFKTLRDFPDIPDVEETEETFEENAKLKARSYFAMTGLPALADDGGLEIDALGGLPGVKSKRWVYGNREATDEELVAHTLKVLSDTPDEQRTARLRSVVVCFDGEEYICEDAAVEGRIVREPSPFAPGFPYRGLLFIPQFGKMYGALNEEEHRAVNHRMLALGRLKERLVRKFGGLARHGGIDAGVE